ncbi:MAG: hypothetical protein R3A44_41170 [Caldilineaceae bacterium]
MGREYQARLWQRKSVLGNTCSGRPEDFAPNTRCKMQQVNNYWDALTGSAGLEQHGGLPRPPALGAAGPHGDRYGYGDR